MRFYLHINKKVLSIIISVSLLVSCFCLPTGAAPAPIENNDTVQEYVPETVVITDEEKKDPETKEDSGSNFSSYTSNGPKLISVQDTAAELNTEFGSYEILQDAFLMAELSGDGTEESPYLIATVDDLKLMSSNVNSGIGYAAHYKLTCDIDLGGAEWTPIGRYTSAAQDTLSFCGVFDGDGHTISNFKITKDSTVFVGLFGRVVGGTIRNLNVDKATININSTKMQKSYVGILAGRVSTTTPGTHAVIEYCNVTDSSITYSNYGTVFAGGITGSAISGPYKDTSVFVAFSNAECSINASSLAKNDDDGTSHVVTAGGLIGYLRAELDSTMTIINCGANATVRGNTLSTVVAQPLCGGVFGDVHTVSATDAGGIIRISACYSEGTVLAETDFHVYTAGGFAGQLYATKNLSVTDCYSSSSVSGRFLQAGKASHGYDPTAGGFVGQVFFPAYSSSYGPTITNCYATGDVAELTHTENTPKDCSFVGGFTGYSSDVRLFKNCYRFDVQKVVGSDILETEYTGITCLSEEDSRLPGKYIGFDMGNIWEIDAGAQFFYPTLREKTIYVIFITDTVSYATLALSSAGKAIKPTKNPTKASSIDTVFVFSHWSSEKGGKAFDFENTVISENTALYAVFSSALRNYKITFMNGKQVFETKNLGYNTPVTAPSGVPTKEDSDGYFYTFLHWSDTEGGMEYDFTDCTVSGNMTFYAVFEGTDKTAWQGGVAESFSGGFGTEAMPYIIRTADEFALFSKLVNNNTEGYYDAHYALASNIHLGGNIAWTPIGNSEDTPFSGSFDGRGFTVAHYVVSDNKYSGLFGNIINGTVKNLAVSDFNINLTPTASIGYDTTYVGAVAGYIASKKGTSTISCVSVTNGNMNINGSIDYLYAGSIIGYGTSGTSGYTCITDSYANNSITAVNDTGYNYLGGIAGQLVTGSGGLSQIIRCYSIGTLDSESCHSSRAGGLVGYLFSNGSAFTSEEQSPDGDASLLADDEDIMIKDSFSITSAYSLSTRYTSYAGRITAERNIHGGVENVFYPRGAGIVIAAEAVATTMNTREDSTGVSTELSNLKSAEYLSASRGFDFENVWTFTTDYEYPVLKCTVADKPELSIITSSLEDGKLEVSFQLMSNVDDYTIVIGVYNIRNQLIGFNRTSYTKTDSVSIVTQSFDNMAAAVSIVVSAYDKESLVPLFAAVTENI